MGQYCHSNYIGSNKYIFVTLHDIFMSNKTYSYHCIIYIYAYTALKIYTPIAPADQRS